MAKLKKGDRIILPSVRPFHWNKKGKMDVFLGKNATIQSVYDKTDTLQQITFVTDDNIVSGPWQFLSTDMEPIFQIGDIVGLKKPFKIFRNFGKKYDICDDNGNCLAVDESEIFKTQSNNNTMKAMKDAVLAVAKSLAKANNTVTTLEIKTELRRDYPYYFWTQKAVSDYMDQLAGDGVFTYKDNGTYRIYSLTKTKATAGPVSKSIVSVTTSTGGGIAKVSGTVATKKAPVRKSKNTTSRATISRANVLKLVTDPNFESMSITGIGTVTLVTVKSQKKSVQGYLTPSKLSKLTHVKVSGRVYEVK